MTVSAISGATVTSPVTNDNTTDDSTSTSTTTGSNQVNSNTFLQLLVAQLEYQDPDNPTDPTTMMSEEASFEEVTQLQSVESASQTNMAASMLGKTITGTDSSGNKVDGVVSGVNLSTGTPTLTVGSSTVPLSGVTTITSPTTTTTATTTTQSSGSSSS